MEKTKRSVQTKLNKIVSVSVTVVLLALTAMLVYLLIRISKGEQADLFGYKLYLVVSDSMEPELNPGDVILSESAGGKTIETGDVITFLGQTGSQKGKIITHKVVQAPYTAEDGKTYLRTQGVKENAPVDSPVLIENVTGIMVTKLAAIGFLIRFVLKPAGFILIIVLPLILLALYQLYRLAKYRVKTEKERLR